MKLKMLFMVLVHLFLLIIIEVQLSAQVTDDFSDGDFTENPTWTGTDTIFVVNADHQLQLNATVSGKASLFIAGANDSCQSALGQDTDYEWHFYIKEAFAPSTKNFTDVILCDNYFIRLGEAGNQDVIDLQRVDGTTIVSICRGSDTFVASPFSTFFMVTRSSVGLWQIFIDKIGSGNYVLEAQCVDSTYHPRGDFGLEATFTKSNATKVFFDDVYVGPKIIDSEPPELENLTVVDEHQIILKFSESVDENTSLENSNYIVDNQLLLPEKVDFSESHSELILTFENVIEEDVYYTLTINKIQDLSGNISENIQKSFLRHVVHENDLVINEIMADPDPPVELPSSEYIEIYNTSDFPIDINGWTLVIGTSEKEITESVVIQPDSYLILCKSDAVDVMCNYGRCYGFSSFAITNGGAEIELRDKNYALMSSVSFKTSWYRDDEKADGGWSLEQIDPESACAGGENWQASVDERGGTPGEINSVNATNLLIPNIDYVDVISQNTVEVVFDQKMDAATFGVAENYYVVEFDAHPDEVATFSERPNVVQLRFNQDFIINSVYNLLINNVLNCTGVPVPEDCRCAFGLPTEPKAGDIVINEILFDPIEPAADYVELLNKTNKIFNLAELKIGVIKTTFPNPPDTTYRQICNESRSFLPNSLIVLTTTPAEIGKQYECGTENFIEMQSMPSFPNSDATTILRYKSKTIDAIDYSEDFHYPLLTETKGVSLERIDDGWHSAAAPLYGTPGYKNSSTVEGNDISNEIEVIPPVFSPDGDGFDDITAIHYKFTEAGFTINITIFDSYGRSVKRLTDNTLAATNGHFCWDGVDSNGNVVSPGIYVIFTEAFDLQGVVKRYKNAVVVATK